jgi:hypothetical protein
MTPFNSETLLTSSRKGEGGGNPMVGTESVLHREANPSTMKASGLTQSGWATATRALSTLRGQGAKGSQGCHQEVTPLVGLL